MGACPPVRSPIHRLIPINGRGVDAMWRSFSLALSSQDTKSGLEGGEYGRYKIYLYTDTSETQKPRPQAQDRYPKCGGHSRMGTDKSLSSVADVHTLMVPRLSLDYHGGHWDKWNCHSGGDFLDECPTAVLGHLFTQGYRR